MVREQEVSMHATVMNQQSKKGSMMKLRGRERWQRILWKDILIIMSVGHPSNRYALFCCSNHNHHYGHWASNQSSRKKALADLQQVQNVNLEKLSEIQSQPESQLKFVVEAWQIVECRRVLKWTYAYGYYLPEHELNRKQFFEYLQGEAEAGLERLHQCAEKELAIYLTGSSKDFNGLRTKLAGLTSVTKNYFENLVRALENGLSDVDSELAAPSKSSGSKNLAGASKVKVGRGKMSSKTGTSNTTSR